MPKQRVLKNRNEEKEQPQQQGQHVGKGQQQLRSTNELQQQPPKKMTITVKEGGQPKEYHYRTTVNSFEELDDVRFQNYCRFNATRHKILNFMKITMPCTTKRMSDHNCDFELRALRSADGHDIHVYEYSQHNHLFESDEKRLSKREMELVPDGNPPSIFRTLDNEWSFLQTSPDYDTFSKFRLKNNCKHRGNTNEKSSRIRCYCVRRCTDDKCKFMLLAMKTTKKGYHVYKNGEHNHPMHKLTKKQRSTRGKKKSRKEQMEDADEEGEVPMENEPEDGPFDGEQQAEDIDQPNQDEQMDSKGREYPLEKCQRRLQSNLRKNNIGRTKKWMGRIERTQIGQVITELDVENVANLLSIADIDISDCEASLDFWLPWIKKALRKREAELIEFIDRFKHLRKIKSLPNKLKGKIRQMLEQRRLEIEEAQKMA